MDKGEIMGENRRDNSERGGGCTPDAPLTTSAVEEQDMAVPKSSTGKSPAFQFYPDDFLADANVIIMTMAERGVYITLLCVCWQQGSLPADTSLLARYCQTPLPAFKKLWPAVERCFRLKNERLIHPRLDHERRKQADYRSKQAENGKKGGRPSKPTETQPLAVGSFGETQTEAKKSSSSPISDLQSSSPDFGRKSGGARGWAPGVMAGSLPRDHMNCRQPCVRVCLSERQHVVFRGKFGGEPVAADAALDGFYAEVRSKLDPDVPIGERSWEFWDKQFAARFASASVSTGKTAGNAAAAALFVGRGQA